MVLAMSAEPPIINQAQLSGIISERPQNFAWFLGAGASRSAGLPTATDIIWDLKRRYYCQQENEEISRQDVHLEAVRSRIQSYMASKGFPTEWAPEEYSTYFEKIFSVDRERQRRYLAGILAEDKATLSVGNRVIGALLASGLSRVAFTTNFDSIVEKAAAEVSGNSLSAYHIEGSRSAIQALNNEEFPFYCKLHGDFRYDSVKNLAADLAAQNVELAQALKIAASRFGFVVVGFSGRDESVMTLFREASNAPNAFPHGFYWTGIKGVPVAPAVEELLSVARAKGVKAAYVAIETFDALMLRLWRNLPGKSHELDKKVRKLQAASVSIPLPGAGTGKPIMRLNALPVTGLPGECQSLAFTCDKEWRELRDAQRESEGRLILTKADTVLAWGAEADVREHFKADLKALAPLDIGDRLLTLDNHLYLKDLLEEALCAAIVRGKPLLARTRGQNAFIIVDAYAQDQSAFTALARITGKVHGQIDGLSAPTDDHHPDPERVRWAEALRVSLDMRDGKFWLIVDPDIWIWPSRARRVADEFMDRRRRDRLNKKYNQLLDAWVHLIAGTDARNTEVTVSAFASGNAAENPSFSFGTR
ncbi:MAG TPA: SIR2 family protein, partial [Rhodomicrobium sp.]|nr:SIR2 family protein [Rhodomicrobium sp.]